MTGVAGFLLALTGCCAVIDWWAVAGSRRTVELAFKPATLVALTATAIALDPADPAVRWWFVAALVFCLAGDVFLLFERWFVPGLVAFLVGHLCYIAGFWIGDLEATTAVVGALAVGAALVAVAPGILRGVRREEPGLLVPVIAYMAVISVMVVGAFGSAIGWAIIGASSFYASDALIAWGKFVEERSWGRMAVIVTYHLGQIALVLSLV